MKFFISSVVLFAALAAASPVRRNPTETDKVPSKEAVALLKNFATVKAGGTVSVDQIARLTIERLKDMHTQCGDPTLFIIIQGTEVVNDIRGFEVNLAGTSSVKSCVSSGKFKPHGNDVATVADDGRSVLFIVSPDV